MDSNKIGRLSAEEVAAAAYSQFGIVADDKEIAAFARWVLEQNGHEKLVVAVKAARQHVVASPLSVCTEISDIDAALAAAGAA